jgi:copper chaperone CopZ
METEFRIEGMSCEHCVHAVKTRLGALPGVREVRVEVGRAVVVSDAPVARDAVASSLDDEGYRLAD